MLSILSLGRKRQSPWKEPHHPFISSGHWKKKNPSAPKTRHIRSAALTKWHARKTDGSGEFKGSSLQRDGSVGGQRCRPQKCGSTHFTHTTGWGDKLTSMKTEKLFSPKCYYVKRLQYIKTPMKKKKEVSWFVNFSLWDQQGWCCAVAFFSRSDKTAGSSSRAPSGFAFPLVGLQVLRQVLDTHVLQVQQMLQFAHFHLQNLRKTRRRKKHAVMLAEKKNKLTKKRKEKG